MKWLSDKLRKLTGGVAWALGIKLALAQVRKVAEGGYGPKWKAWYQAASGLKTVTGIVLAVVTIVIAAVVPGDSESGLMAAKVLGGVAAFLVSAGLCDKEWRDTSLAVRLRGYALYQKLLDWSPVLTVVFGVWASKIQAGACLWDCSKEKLILAALTAVCVQAGLMSAAQKAPAPAPRG